MKSKSLGAVVRELREQRGMNLAELAEAPGVGLDSANLSRFERDQQGITLPKLEALARQLGMRTSELLALSESIDTLEPEAAKGEGTSDAYTFVNRAHGPHLSAGTGEVVWDFEEIERSHAFRRDWMQKEGLNPGRCKIFDVRGDSMSPTISDGSTVMINMADRDVQSGEVYALIADDGLRVKRLHKRSGGIWMYSDNPDQLRYPPELIQDNHAAVIGRVVWRGGNL